MGERKFYRRFQVDQSRSFSPLWGMVRDVRARERDLAQPPRNVAQTQRTRPESQEKSTAQRKAFEKNFNSFQESKHNHNARIYTF